MFLRIATFNLLPILVIQGYRVKKYTPRLVEPQGFRTGNIGQGKALSILILGDSAAAGVGVDHQNQALLGSLLTELKQDFNIQFQLEARTGDTTLQVVARAQQLNNQHFDVVITSVGVNDVTKLIPPKKWIQQQQLFYSTIERQFSPQLVLVTAVPPMNLFPALPNPLGWLFGKYSSVMNQQLADFVSHKSHYKLMQFDLARFKEMNLEMAQDGFHPSQEIYQVWAGEMAKHIKLNF